MWSPHFARITLCSENQSHYHALVTLSHHVPPSASDKTQWHAPYSSLLHVGPTLNLPTLLGMLNLNVFPTCFEDATFVCLNLSAVSCNELKVVVHFDFLHEFQRTPIPSQVYWQPSYKNMKNQNTDERQPSEKLNLYSRLLLLLKKQEHGNTRTHKQKKQQLHLPNVFKTIPQ